MMRILAWGLGGVFWTLAFFFLGLYITFPSDTVRERIEYQSVLAFDKEFSLAVGSVHPWFTGARLEDVTLHSLKRGRRTRDNPDPGYDRTPVVTATSLVLKARPVAWVMRHPAIGWSASLLGGTFAGGYEAAETAVDMDFSLSGIDLAQLPFDSPDRQLHFTGTLDGDATFHFDSEDIKTSTGTFTLSAEGFGLASGSTLSGFQLPEASFTRAQITAAMDNGKLVLSEGTFEGPVLSAELGGDITMNKKLSRSRYRLDLAFTLPEEFDKLAQLSTQLKRSKDEEGRYHCSVSGQLTAPSFRCGKVTGRRTTTDQVDRPSVTGASGGADDDASDEERRAAREERIKERRERLKKRREEAAKTRGEMPDLGAVDPRRPGDVDAGPGMDFPDQPPNAIDENMPDGYIPPPDVELPPFDPQGGDEEGL